MLPDPDDRYDFPGIEELRPRVPAKAEQTETGLDLFYDTFGATFRLDPRNDLDTHRGIETIKKRIIRRLMTSPGGFSHLETYGAGIRTKEPANTTNLNEIRASVLRQVEAEEEVVRASVNVSFQAGVLFVDVKARTRRDQFALGFEIPEEGEIIVS